MTTLAWDRHRGRASSYDVVLPGFNYRLDEVRAAIRLVQLRRLLEENAGRARIVAAYREALDGLDGLTVPSATATVSPPITSRSFSYPKAQTAQRCAPPLTSVESRQACTTRRSTPQRLPARVAQAAAADRRGLGAPPHAAAIWPDVRRAGRSSDRGAASDVVDRRLVGAEGSGHPLDRPLRPSSSDTSGAQPSSDPAFARVRQQPLHIARRGAHAVVVGDDRDVGADEGADPLD